MTRADSNDSPYQSAIMDLNNRSRDVLRLIVEHYVESGEPIGSRTLSRLGDIGLSPASIRNVMADLEDAGLLAAPHTSAGRLPTDLGMRLFVHGLLEVGRLSEEERSTIDGRCAVAGVSADQVLEQAIQSLTGLSQQAGLVVVPKSESALKHIEFVTLSPGRALVVMVMENGAVENRVVEVPLDLPPSAMIQAGNYLSARLLGRTMSQARGEIMQELESHRAQIDSLASDLVEKGLATWGGEDRGSGALIVRGQSRLLGDVTALEDLERVRRLFETLETKETMVNMLDLAQDAEGVQIFIGSESELFRHTGCSLIISPYHGSDQQVIGAIGVIGPMRMNYARIIPMVDYTAQVVGRLLG